MKANTLIKQICHRATKPVLGLGLVLLYVHWPLPAAAQANYSTPYTFTTLAEKSTIGNTTNVARRTPLSTPKAVAVDAAGNVYTANFLNQTICRITPQGEATILAGKPGVIGSEDGTGSEARFR